jgi:hypothetical protein
MNIKDRSLFMAGVEAEEKVNATGKIHYPTFFTSVSTPAINGLGTRQSRNSMAQNIILQAAGKVKQSLIEHFINIKPFSNGPIAYLCHSKTVKCLTI